ncbi:hypothetical protein [Actinophytocola xanthii]|uniref:DUF4386 domain-containing protein n=1 Tax=Actinophytocola xanthii TaxID=1912961 RepID=A0A1Q8CSL9_9PSEU|nr:hypothetical protein [Actinophytocola xanthii]OLF17333.1 hypothetical protein BU204_11995 [Actinophytocola xanthii]
MTSTVPRETHTSTEAGSSVAVPAVVTVGLFLASLVAGLVSAGAVYTSPFVDDGDIGEFYAEHTSLVAWVGLLQFAAGLALAVCTATLVTRLRLLAPEAAARTATAFAGGLLAGAFLALNGLVQWVMAHPGVTAEPAVRRAMHYLYFGLGGFAHVAAGAVLVGAVALVARRSRLLPVWLTATGLAIAVVSLASGLTFVTEAATTLIPIGRFAALLWLVAVGFLLPRQRREVPRRV